MTIEAPIGAANTQTRSVRSGLVIIAPNRFRVPMLGVAILLKPNTDRVTSRPTANRNPLTISAKRNGSERANARVGSLNRVHASKDGSMRELSLAQTEDLRAITFRGICPIQQADENPQVEQSHFPLHDERKENQEGQAGNHDENYLQSKDSTRSTIPPT